MLARSASAQAPSPPPPAREGSADFAFVGTSGNASTRSIGLGGDLVFRPAPWEAKVKLNYVRNETDGEVKAQAFVLTGRAQRSITPRLSGFGQYGYQRDRFAGILNRHGVEGGVAYSLVKQAPHALAVDAALGYANEQRLLGDNLSTPTLGAGGLYTLKISETSDLTEDGHFLFSLSDRDDWRYSNAVALTARMTTVLSLKLSNTTRYVHMPVFGFKRTDSLTAIALVAKF